jgi:hypothetical protein
LIKYIGLSFIIDDSDIPINKITVLINSINFELIPDYKIQSNQRHSIDNEIGFILNYIKSNEFEQDFDSNLLLALNSIESQVKIIWDSIEFRAKLVYKDLELLKNKLSSKNHIEIIKKLIQLNYFEECEYFTSKLKNINYSNNYFNNTFLYSFYTGSFQMELFEKIMDICIEKYPKLIRLFIEKKFINCTIDKEYYWTTYTFPTNQFEIYQIINSYGYSNRNNNNKNELEKVVFKYKYYMDKLQIDLKQDNFKLNNLKYIKIKKWKLSKKKILKTMKS